MVLSHAVHSFYGYVTGAPAPFSDQEIVSRSQTASSPPFLYTDVIGRGRQYIKMEGRKRSG